MTLNHSDAATVTPIIIRDMTFIGVYHHCHTYHSAPISLIRLVMYVRQTSQKRTRLRISGAIRRRIRLWRGDFNIVASMRRP